MKVKDLVASNAEFRFWLEEGFTLENEPRDKILEMPLTEFIQYSREKLNAMAPEVEKAMKTLEEWIEQHE